MFIPHDTNSTIIEAEKDDLRFYYDVYDGSEDSSEMNGNYIIPPVFNGGFERYANGVMPMWALTPIAPITTWPRAPMTVMPMVVVAATREYPKLPQLRVTLTKTFKLIKDLDTLQYVALYSLIIATIVSVLTALIGVMTWLLIPNWRKFRNYVFLMIVVTFAILYCLVEASRVYGSEYWLKKASDLFLCACAWWLLVATVMFYMDIVKVFRSGVSKRTVKSSLLVWGVAITTTAVSVIDDASWEVLQSLQQYDVFLLIPLVVNCVVYARVLRSLLRETGMRSTQKRRKSQAETFAFLMSGAVMLAAVLAAEPLAAPPSLTQLVYALQTTAIDVCFLMLKGNRQAWSDYYRELKMAISS